MAQKALSQDGGEAYTVATRFPREQHAQVLELANAAGVTRSEFIRGAVERELERAGAEAAGE
jgi:predicted DNA-binding protein